MITKTDLEKNKIIWKPFTKLIWKENNWKHCLSNHLFLWHLARTILTTLGYPCLQERYLRKTIHLSYSLQNTISSQRFHLEQVGHDDVLALCPMENVIIEHRLVHMAVRVGRISIWCLLRGQPVLKLDGCRNIEGALIEMCFFLHLNFVEELLNWVGHNVFHILVCCLIGIHLHTFIFDSNPF